MDERAPLVRNEQKAAAGRGTRRKAPAAKVGGLRPLGDGQQQQQQQQGMDFDRVALHTEEQLQREKLSAVLDVEADAREIKGCYEDLGALVDAQQKPLDTVEANVDTAGDKVTRGADELHEAREQQTKARKKMCALLVILAIIAAVVVVVIVVVTKH